MKLTTKFLTLIFATVLLIGSTAVAASAQTRGGVRRIHRPIVVVRPYYYYRYNPYWHWNSWNNPYFYDPYLSAQRQQYYLEQELRGNKEELRKHLEKYNADGMITAKERKELDDDYRDVARSEQKLKAFLGED